MQGQQLRRLIFFGALLFVALGLLVGCERPDPQETVAAPPSQTPTPLPVLTLPPTQPPIQVYVVVVQPTADSSQPVATNLPVMAPTVPPAESPPSPTPEASLEPTPWPEDFFLGWAWTDSLIADEDTARAVVQGLTLRDRPSFDGREVGVVIGLSDVFVVGRERCGYTPVLVHADNMLSRTTPHPEIYPLEPLPTAAPPFEPTPFPTGNATSGWAYTNEITVLGETAISGALGINLRSAPCVAGTNLGFVPAGSNMIVSGLPSGDYTPVLIQNIVLQPPFEFSELAVARPGDVITSRTELRPLAAPPTPVDLSALTPTPAGTGTSTPTASPTPVPSLTPDSP